MSENVMSGVMPVLALRGLAVFPNQTVHFDVGREKSIKAIDAAMKGDRNIYLVPQMDFEIEDPTKIPKSIAMDIINDGSGYFRWIKDQSQIPVQKCQVEIPDIDGGVAITAMPWIITNLIQGSDVVKMQRTKPGVEYYEVPTYEITEWGQYKTKSQCKWALIEGGKLAFPLCGDFGIQNYQHPNFLTATPQITAGYWLCEGGNITFDGKYYNATCKYIWSPQPSGWDLDLYTFFSGFAYYKQKSQANPNPIVGTDTNNGSIFDGHGNTQGNVTNPIIPNGGN